LNVTTYNISFKNEEEAIRFLEKQREKTDTTTPEQSE